MDNAGANKSKSKTVIISGSARNDGNTHKVVAELINISGWDHVELIDFNISHFDYQHRNRDDDFIPLVKRIVDDYDVLVFATPVYWYSMSGVMKVFFDRLTDLLRIEKDTGRKLRNKYMAVISCSNGSNLGENFWLPFKNSAEYLGMTYLADLHTYQDLEEPGKIAEFKNVIEQNI